MTPDKAALFDLIKTLPLMFPFANVESITNELIFNVAPLPEVFVTVIVQSEYVPSPKEFRVIVLFPTLALSVLDEQEPPYVMVPASVVEKV